MEQEFLCLKLADAAVVIKMLERLDEDGIFNDFMKSEDIFIENDEILVCTDAMLYVALMLNEMALRESNHMNVKLLIDIACELLSANIAKAEQQVQHDYWLKTNITSRCINSTAH